MVAVIQRRDHLEVLDARLGLRPQKDIPFDTADAPKVLALQIGARAPTEDLQGQYVLARLQVAIEQELRRVLRVLAVTYLLTVQIDIESALRSGDVEIDVSSLPISRNLDLPPINTYGIRLRQLRRLWVTRLELITMIRINRHTMSLHLPVARHLNLSPIG